MDTFPTRVRASLAAQGMSMRSVARAVHYDPAYLSRVFNGKQAPSMQLAEALDTLLGTNGELASLAVNQSVPATTGQTGVESDIAYMKSSAMHLLTHGDRHGGDAVASASVQVWKSAQRKLDTGLIPENRQRDYLSAVAESAEVAGWLLFDAGQWEAARAAFLESHMLAGHANDRSMQWFALDMLAMLDIERNSPGEARRIADELLAQRVPPRVATLARVRRGRALAQIGDHQRTLINLNEARGGVEDSLSSRDPEWAWWVDEGEVEFHTGAALIDLGSPEEAASTIQGAIERLSIPDGRGALHLRIVLLSALAESKAWRDAEAGLEPITALLQSVSSGRSRHILRGVLRTIDREPKAPARLLDLTRETAAALAV